MAQLLTGNLLILPVPHSHRRPISICSDNISPPSMHAPDVERRGTPGNRSSLITDENDTPPPSWMSSLCYLRISPRPCIPLGVKKHDSREIDHGMIDFTKPTQQQFRGIGVTVYMQHIQQHSCD
jgi:hypothetical protein